MNSINFDNPWLLIIAIPLAAIFLVPFFIAVRKENRNGHNVASIIMHVAMAVIIGFAAAGTTFVAVLTRTEVYVVADVSYSANKNLDLLDTYIKNLKLPQNSEVGLVCFGKDCELLSAPTTLSRLPSVKTAEVDDSQTDIAGALEYAGDLFGNGVIKRIVLITDAKQTDESDSYAIRRAVDGLETKDIRVDAIYLDDNIDENVQEVQISDAEFTRTAYLGGDESVNLTVRTTYATDEATFTLRRDGEEVAHTAPELTEGANVITFGLYTEEAGTYSYEVEVSAPADGSAKNNVYSFTQTVSDSINILMITEDFASVRGAVEKYGDNCSLEIYEHDLNNRVQTKANYIKQFENNPDINIYTFGSETAEGKGLNLKNVPCTVEELCVFDEIILSDVDVGNILNATEFMGSLDTVVSMFGKSLTTYGDLKVQTGETEEVTALGEMLPVKFGNNGDPRLLALVIDSSYSMNQNNHFRVAKQLATRVANLLSEGDQVCIVTFFGEARLVLQPTDGSNQAVIAQAIDDLRVQQGTLIGSGLYNAYRIIDGLSYSQKQVMLITDGSPFGDDDHDPVEVASDMRDSGIVTSVFDVGRPSAFVGDPEQLLRDIASAGGGTYYLSNEQEDLDENIFLEIADEQVEHVVQNHSTPVGVNRPADAVLENLDVRNIPQITGFVNSKQKAGAVTVLQAEYKKTETSAVKNVPLYSYWNYGNGKVATFTSKFAGDWVDNWESSATLGVFLNNVVRTELPDEKTDYPFVFNVERGGGYTAVQVVPATSRFNAEATVEITRPDGQTESANLAFNQYYYYYDFESAEEGVYNVTVTYNYYEKTYTATAAITVPYTDEYDEFASYDPSVLYRALNGRGEVSVNGELELVNDENLTGTYSVNLTVPLLIICVVLYIADIVVRKLKWDDIVSFFGAFGKGGENK